eukprot:TRINITY_DN85323_c0_g1_i1.p1 TRINITY_DN85323_c0_g1~~TRINITY_DN85323_c0_g1_i1.p1  ORF type:complete len:190 (+),score=23.67 TRINITY_DN85323_c0_g1_i1:58-627(+)
MHVALLIVLVASLWTVTTAQEPFADPQICATCETLVSALIRQYTEKTRTEAKINPPPGQYEKSLEEVRAMELLEKMCSATTGTMKSQCEVAVKEHKQEMLNSLKEGDTQGKVRDVLCSAYCAGLSPEEKQDPIEEWRRIYEGGGDSWSATHWRKLMEDPLAWVIGIGLLACVAGWIADCWKDGPKRKNS